MNTNNGIIAGVVSIVVVALGCATALTIFAPEADLAPVLALVGSTVATLATLAKLQGVDAKVDQVDKRTEDLTNGLMDAKIRAGVADVIRPEHVDPEMADQLEADRTRRDQRATQ